MKAEITGISWDNSKGADQLTGISLDILWENDEERIMLGLIEITPDFKLEIGMAGRVLIPKKKI